MNSKPHAIALVNPHAKGGSGLKRWNSVKPLLEQAFELECIETGPDLRNSLKSALERGTRIFLPAGGDGTVHLAINTLLDARGSVPLAEITLGAIGLGSSNDFHKPIEHSHLGIPLRVNPAGRLRDVGFVKFTDAQGKLTERAFLVSSSIGLVADANRFFNSKDRLLQPLKRHWTDGAILYSAIRTIAGYQNAPVQVTLPHFTAGISLTSLHLLKTPFLSGSFRFDTPALRDNGKFCVNWMEEMGKGELLKVLVDLSFGKYLKGKSWKKRKHFETDQVVVESDQELALELDGELYFFKKAEFSIYPEKLREAI